MKSIGFDGPWGVEILSDEHRALPVAEALRLAQATALACFPANRAVDRESSPENVEAAAG
jgi:hypothetical protein